MIRIKFGFSTNDLNFYANLATVAPSSTLWSADMLILIASIGTHLYPFGLVLSSTYKGTFLDFPIAIIAPYGLKIVGTKYVPPMFPTLDTLNVAFSKSLGLSYPLSAFSLRLIISLLISKILLS